MTGKIKNQQEALDKQVLQEANLSRAMLREADMTELVVLPDGTVDD